MWRLHDLVKKGLFPLDAYMVSCPTWSKNLERTLDWRVVRVMMQHCRIIEASNFSSFARLKSDLRNWVDINGPLFFLRSMNITSEFPKVIFRVFYHYIKSLNWTSKYVVQFLFRELYIVCNSKFTKKLHNPSDIDVWYLLFCLNITFYMHKLLVTPTLE